MEVKFKNAEGPVTSRQTFALKCCTGRDFRPDLNGLNINRKQFSEVLAQCNTVKAAQNMQAAEQEAERLLANYAS